MAKATTKAKVYHENPNAPARLTLVVEFDDDIEESEVNEIVDSARSYGTIVRASFERLTPVNKELI